MTPCFQKVAPARHKLSCTCDVHHFARVNLRLNPTFLVSLETSFGNGIVKKTFSRGLRKVHLQNMCLMMTHGREKLKECSAASKPNKYIN